jgi:hypothetical protein
LPRRTLSGRLAGLVLLVVGVTIAGGLGLFVAGARPRESLHFVYAILAIGAIPVASSLAGRMSPRQEALTTLAAALVVVVLIARLFQTG